MKCRNGNLAGGVARLLFAPLVFFACVTLFTESAQAQRPAPTPIDIDDGEFVGEPKRVELEEGKYKLVHRNKAGQVLYEEEYVLGVKVNSRCILQVFPNGQEAEVSIWYFRPDGSRSRIEHIHYDRFGNPQEREWHVHSTELTPPINYEKWNPRTKQWEPAPENLRWNPAKGAWEEVPKEEREKPPTRKCEYVPPSATPPSDVSYNGTEFFVGFSHNRVDGDEEDDDILEEADGREGFNGFEAAITGNVSRYVGLKGDYSFHRNSFELAPDFNLRTDIHQILGGVQIQDNALAGNSVRPFAHFLAGVAHQRLSISSSDETVSKTGFAAAFGGGIDIRVSDRVDFRAVQFDYNPNRIAGQTQHNFRIGVGIVFR